MVKFLHYILYIIIIIVIIFLWNVIVKTDEIKRELDYYKEFYQWVGKEHPVAYKHFFEPTNEY